MRRSPSRRTRTAPRCSSARRHEADEIVAKAKTDAEALIERRTRMAEDKIAAEERAAVEQLRATAADAAAKAAARLIAERHDAGTDAKLVDQAIKEIAGALSAYCWCWPPGWLTPSSACSRARCRFRG